MTALAALPPVDLAELTERAGLMTRVDRKYLLPRADVEALLEELTGRLRVLEIDGRRVFRYRSTYYDTPDLAAFRAVAGRRRRRAKVRSREYLDTGATFLEVKTPTTRGGSAKQRIPLPPEEGDGPLEGESLTFVAEALDIAGCDFPPEDLVPVLRTRYERATLLVEDEASRLTIDTGVTWTRPSGGYAPDSSRGSRPAGCADLDGLVVLETKAGTRPGSADRALWTAGHRPVRLSKYATGLALLDPDLPDNRWHRTLRAVRAA